MGKKGKIKNFKSENFDGSIFDFDKYRNRNRVLLIFFRGAWCNICKKQLLEIEQNKKYFIDNEIKVLAIAPDSKLKLSLLKTAFRLSFDILADENLEIIKQFGLEIKYKQKLTSKPAVFYVSESGEIIYQFVGDDYDDRMSIASIKKATGNF